MQTSINPATGDIIQHYPIHSASDVQTLIGKAHAAYLQWRLTPLDQRAAMLMRVSDQLLKEKERYAKLIALEMGKPFKESISEVEKCALGARYFAEQGPTLLADQIIKTDYSKSYVTFQPMGIVLGVMPWNFPFWQVFRFALPTLMGGNVGILKHASNTPGCALAIESIFKDAGFPDHTFTSLLIPGSRVEEVIAHPHITAVTLTGSTPAGRAVAANAGKYLKKTVLELGGSDPYVILKDADIEHAIKTCGGSRLNNCGQSCVSAKRMIVVPEVKGRFEAGLVDIFRKQILGDPLDPTTTVGPMSRSDLRDELHDQVQRTVKDGATLLHGGTIPDKAGAFYTPTILANVTKGMAAYEEELFGPVAVIIPAKDEADALRIANDTVFGLGGAVFTQDIARGEKIAREQIQSGACFVNMMVRSDPRLPFGGIKDSGYGRELSGFGLHEFVNIKTIIVA
ncbi:MAG: NAD-dependent succinate-semialdehyde dehydrogenase [Rickettsiales bacterium]|nr:NAD-dependent succinate-semialdehyde dehydrogenase [Rickettsiales bacterium]